MKIELLSLLVDIPPSLAALPVAAEEIARARTVTRRLEHGQVIRVDRSLPFKKIEVRSGVLWLTGSPAEGDIILEQGRTFEFGKRWPYVIEAIKTAEFSMM